jgi:DNA processing protein
VTRAGDDWRSWLALRAVRGVGPVVYQGLLRAFGEPSAIFQTTQHALECAGVRPEVARAIRAFDDWAAVDALLERLHGAGASLVTWNDSVYPANLREIHDPPPFLFVQGELLPRDLMAVALVGSRNVSAYGMRMTRELAEGLVRYGVTVVSGLARGTDAGAHWTTLRAGGRTIAVFRAISQQGAVVTELPMGAQPDAENFPNRNRIISGLTLGTVIVEAAERSGSLITATLAAEQGREVFAVPGAVGERTRGTHRLIREGAKLTECAEDVLEEIAPQLLSRVARAAPVELDRAEAAVVSCMRHETLHIDQIIARSAMPPATVLQLLLALELKGVVQQLPGKHFVASAVDVPRSPAKE